MSQFFTSGGQSIGVSASTSVLRVPGLISFRMDWLDFLAVQGTLKSLLILWCSAFFIVQFSHPYMTTGKTIALTRWTFVGNKMSVLFNMLSRLVITFLIYYITIFDSPLLLPFSSFIIFLSEMLIFNLFFIFYYVLYLIYIYLHLVGL